MVSQVRVVDWRVLKAMEHSEGFVEVYAYVVDGTDLAGRVVSVSLIRRGAEGHSGIAAERLDHREAGTAGAVQNAGC